MLCIMCCITCALDVFNGDCNFTCLLVALRVPKMCLRAAKTRKKLESFVKHTCLGPGAQLLFRHKKRIGIQLLFYFVVLVNMVESIMRMSFFFIWGQNLGRSFRALQCHRNVCSWIPKLI